MELDPLSRTLWTDDGCLIKVLRCNKLVGAEDLGETQRGYLCTLCRNEVVDVSDFSDDQAVAAVAKDPDVCFAIRADHAGPIISHRSNKTRHDARAQTGSPGRPYHNPDGTNPRRD